LEKISKYWEKELIRKIPKKDAKMKIKVSWKITTNIGMSLKSF